MPKVSVVIPNYNHALYLKERIDSVLNQIYQDFEVIILDDCSTDNSRDIIQLYRNHPKVSHVIYNEKNSGSTFKQWEKGISLSTGEYIWLAESDDFVNELFLEVAVHSLDDTPRASLFFCQSNSIDTQGKVTGNMHWWTDPIEEFNWHKSFTSYGDDFVKKVLFKKNVIVNASGVLIRAKNVSNNLTFCINYKMCGDWLLWTLLLKGNEITYSCKRMNYFRSHANTTRINLTIEQKMQRLVEEISVKQHIISVYNIRQINQLYFLWRETYSFANFKRGIFCAKLIYRFNLILPKHFWLRFLYFSLKNNFNALSHTSQRNI